MHDPDPVQAERIRDTAPEHLAEAIKVQGTEVTKRTKQIDKIFQIRAKAARKKPAQLQAEACAVYLASNIAIGEVVKTFSVAMKRQLDEWLVRFAESRAGVLTSERRPVTPAEAPAEHTPEVT